MDSFSPTLTHTSQRRILLPAQENNMSSRQLLVWVGLVALGFVIVHFGTH